MAIPLGPISVVTMYHITDITVFSSSFSSVPLKIGASFDITTALVLAGRGLGAEPTNKLLQKLLTLHCLPLPFLCLDRVSFWTDHKFVIRVCAALFLCL